MRLLLASSFAVLAAGCSSASFEVASPVDDDTGVGFDGSSDDTSIAVDANDAGDDTGGSPSDAGIDTSVPPPIDAGGDSGHVPNDGGFDSVAPNDTGFDTAPSDSGNVLDTGRDAASDAGATACPAAMPTPGTLCVGGAVCGYGDDPRPGCRAVMTCNGVIWKKTTSACAPLDQSACPATTPVGICDPSSAPAVCGAYTDGSVCVCGACFGGPCTPKPTWHCATASDPDCPITFPNLGTPCSNAGLTCQYGLCTTATWGVVSCQGGVWTQGDPACAT